MPLLRGSQPTQHVQRAPETEIQTLVVEVDEEDLELRWKHYSCTDLLAVLAVQGTIRFNTLVVEKVSKEWVQMQDNALYQMRAWRTQAL